MDPILVLIRHSLPEIDLAVPAARWRLSRNGRARCHALADRLARYDLDAIVSSTEPKAIGTAEIVAHQLGLSFETVDGLQEHDRSDVVGLDRTQFRDAVARLFSHPHDLVLGNETAEQARQRFAISVGSVLERYPNANVAVVAHGTVISLFVAGVTVLDAHAFWQRLGMPCYVVLSRPDLRLIEVVETVD